MSVATFSPDLRQSLIDFLFDYDTTDQQEEQRSTYGGEEGTLTTTSWKIIGGDDWNWTTRIHVSKAFLFLSWILWTFVQAVIPLLVVHWRIQRYIQRPNRNRREPARIIHVM